MLVLTVGLGRHTILGSTLDDSIGEAFDKTARLLGLPQVRVGCGRLGIGRTRLGSGLGSGLGSCIGQLTRRACELAWQIPGGPALEKLARDGDERRHNLPYPSR